VTKLSPVQSKEILGTIVIKLYDDINPLTCQNFRELATGQHGYGYEGTLFNRVIPGCLMQAGQVVTPSGHRGRVVYNRTLAGMLIFQFVYIIHNLEI
jgi:peptidylprolyl isomerase